MPTTTTTNSPPPPLPPPQTFDILPTLTHILTLLLPTNTNNPSSPPTNNPTVDPKDLIPELNALKLKIEKARQAIAGLPDVERSVEEQEGEIEELVRRVEGGRGVLRALGEGGAGDGTG
ncbi:MAG: hypothetical protein M1830_001473 [Pleopsidium flavum]|nr:MAG: hypothetical protein M1830_001473 [Pleopsidium flavum]